MNTSEINSSHKKELAESVIREARETIDYNTVEYPLEYFVDQVSQQQINDNLQWDELQQSYFIESLLLDLPALKIVFIDQDNNYTYSIVNNLEQIIDGKQRLLTALNFFNGNLRLTNLKVLNSLNDFDFKDLILSRQRRFGRSTVRAIAVNPNSDLSVWWNKY